MKISYQFVNGERSEIEVDDCWAAEIEELDRIETNNNRSQTRRHYSIEALPYEGEYFVDKTDLSSEYEARCEIENLLAALGSLSPSQKELVKKVFYEEYTMAAVARSEGVTKQSIYDRFQTVYKKLQKNLQK